MRDLLIMLKINSKHFWKTIGPQRVRTLPSVSNDHEQDLSYDEAASVFNEYFVYFFTEELFPLACELICVSSTVLCEPVTFAKYTFWPALNNFLQTQHPEMTEYVQNFLN